MTNTPPTPRLIPVDDDEPFICEGEPQGIVLDSDNLPTTGSDIFLRALIDPVLISPYNIKLDPIDIEYPHYCQKCKRQLKFQELVNANIPHASEMLMDDVLKERKKLEKLWTTNHITIRGKKILFQYDFYCCSCFRRETNEDLRIHRPVDNMNEWSQEYEQQPDRCRTSSENPPCGISQPEYRGESVFQPIYDSVIAYYNTVRGMVEANTALTSEEIIDKIIDEEVDYMVDGKDD